MFDDQKKNRVMVSIRAFQFRPIVDLAGSDFWLAIQVPFCSKTTKFIPSCRTFYTLMICPYPSTHSINFFSVGLQINIWLFNSNSNKIFFTFNIPFLFGRFRSSWSVIVGHNSWHQDEREWNCELDRNARSNFHKKKNNMKKIFRNLLILGNWFSLTIIDQYLSKLSLPLSFTCCWRCFILYI